MKKIFVLASIPILATAIVHAIWGTVFIVSDLPLVTTLTTSLVDTAGHKMAGVIYVLASVLSLYGLYNHKSQFSDTFYHLPQQFLIVMSLITIINSIRIGTFPDGYVASGLFIFVDKLLPIVWSVAHLITTMLLPTIDFEESYGNT